MDETSIHYINKEETRSHYSKMCAKYVQDVCKMCARNVQVVRKMCASCAQDVVKTNSAKNFGSVITWARDMIVLQKKSVICY